jgi:ABC-type multidrug transport system permease subunit
MWATVYGLAMASTALGVLLGCSVEDPKLGQEMLPLLFVPQMLFAGFFVTPELIPVWLRWARYLCTLTFAIRIILVAEFEDCAKTQTGCAMLLNNVDANPDEVWWNWLVLVSLFVFFRVSALLVLRKKATKFF